MTTAAHAAPPAAPSSGADPKMRLRIVALAALGIVYGDIGTSPLYALRECFHPQHGVPLTEGNIFGVVSLIFWSLIVVVSVKYLLFILRADNRGEGGIMALMALAGPHLKSPRVRVGLVLLGLFGAALLYGDGMITPSISVLSAVEGLGVATPVFEPYVLPITVAVLIFLFALQKRGTAGVARIFGPVMLVWFTTLALLGVWHIAEAPRILAALSPHHGFHFLLQSGWPGFLALGAVFLVVTGGESLYADLGHFGPRPIRAAWFAVVLPALAINYFGQGALLLDHPEAVVNPFFRMAAGPLRYPLVILATAAAVIASQALISGAFSLTMQAVQLGYVPRFHIEHTSHHQKGQVYLPAVNWILMLACIGLVLGFETSSNLAAAYGIAVSSTMVITTIYFVAVAWRRWHWPLAAAAAFCAVFLTIDFAFFGANLVKIPHGGWFPLLVALAIFSMMTAWRRGRAMLGAKLRPLMIPLEKFLAQIEAHPPQRVPGTAVFMSGNPAATPSALLHNLKHNKVLHERIVILSVVTEDIPRVSRDRRVHVEQLAGGFYRLAVHYGFMEDPDVPAAIRMAAPHGLDIDPAAITYFLGRENLRPGRKRGLGRWRDTLFIWMSRHALDATRFYRLPPNQVVELGTQIIL